MNINVTPDILKDLAKDPDKYVKIAVLKNKNTPLEVKKELEKDPVLKDDPYLRRGVEDPLK